jgi:hypothetical protein
MIIDWGLGIQFDGFEPFIFETYSYGIIIDTYDETFKTIAKALNFKAKQEILNFKAMQEILSFGAKGQTLAFKAFSKILSFIAKKGDS